MAVASQDGVADAGLAADAAIGPDHGAADDGVFFDLASALSGLGRSAEARLYYDRVVTEYPKSPYAGKARQKLGTMKTA